MDLYQALILGLIQGLTEFLPISSSGHLIFVPRLFGWVDQGLAFDVVVHLGTLVAVVVYFRAKLWRLLKSLRFPRRSGDLLAMTDQSRLAWFVLLSIIPAGIVGLLIGDWVEQSARSAIVVGTSLIVWGMVLAAADGFAKGLAKHNMTMSASKMDWKQALFISCAQAIALIPGTSRSGITMTAGLFARLDKKSAAEFSFLMSVPVILVAGALKVFELFQSSVAIDWIVFGVGFIASAVSGFIAIGLLMKIIQRWSFMPFVVYRIAVGTLILFYLV